LEDFANIVKHILKTTSHIVNVCTNVKWSKMAKDTVRLRVKC